MDSHRSGGHGPPGPAVDGLGATPSGRLRALLAALPPAPPLPAGHATFTGADPVLPCRYPLGETAAAVLAAVGLAAVDAGRRRGGPALRVSVDVRHAGAHLRGFLDQIVDGEVLDADPTARLPAVGLHRTGDGGWVQVYGAFPPLLARTLTVLECAATHADVAAAVGRWGANALVAALVAAGAPAAQVQTAGAWATHSQGTALGALAPVLVERVGAAPSRPLPSVPPAAAGNPAAARPLAGVRVVDLSRIVAGPVCARTLAEHGADVTQVVDPRLHTVRRAQLDTAAGKRIVRLDLRRPADHDALLALIDRADVVVQNARPGSFAARGLGAEALAARRPGLVYVSIDAYGHVGPWAARRGFEPLAQASTGWAADHAYDGRPRVVPGLPCDYLSGFLAALGAVQALRCRAEDGGSWHVRTSLARTAMWLRAQPGRHDPSAAPPLDAPTTRDLRVGVPTRAGVLERLRPAVILAPPR